MVTGGGKLRGEVNLEKNGNPKKRRIEFTVVGEPVAKARPRVTRSGAVYTPKKTSDYESIVRMILNASMPLKTHLEPPIRAELNFHFSSARKKCGYKVTRSDLDNLVKSVLDACNGIAYKDDAGVAVLVARKYWSDESKTVVILEEL